MRRVYVDFGKYEKLYDQSFVRRLGKVVNVVGLTIESAGPDAKLGDVCQIYPEGEDARPIMAEVVGFKDKKTLLMPYDSVDGIGLGSMVENTGHPLTVYVDDSLLGQTLDGLGRPLDGRAPSGTPYTVEAAPPDPMEREIIDQVLPLGVKAVDGLITVGKGQRIGIFAGSGEGKSTLLGMFARNTKGYQCDRAHRRAGQGSPGIYREGSGGGRDAPFRGGGRHFRPPGAGAQ